MLLASRAALHASLFEPTVGAIVIANFLALPLQPGAIGKPVPGMQAAVVRAQNRRLERVQDGEGELALQLRREGGEGESGADALQDVAGWFTTGRRAFCDAAGDFWLAPAAQRE